MTRRHLELARKTGSRLLELQALGNLGTLLGRMESSPEVFKLLEEATTLSRKYGGSEALSISLANQGREFRRVGNLEKGLDFYRQAFQVCKVEGLGVNQIEYSFEITHLLLEMGMLDKAAEEIEQIEAGKVPDTNISNLVYCKAKLFRLQDKIEEAETLLGDELTRKEEETYRYELLHELFRCNGDVNLLPECLNLGEVLFNEVPSWDFRVKLDELKELMLNTEN